MLLLGGFVRVFFLVSEEATFKFKDRGTCRGAPKMVCQVCLDTEQVV